jgi:hypothetical protein
VPLFAVRALAARVIVPSTPYVELKYRQALALSTTHYGGVVLFVAFRVFYGQGGDAGFGQADAAAAKTFASPSISSSSE